MARTTQKFATGEAQSHFTLSPGSFSHVQLASFQPAQQGFVSPCNPGLASPEPKWERPGEKGLASAGRWGGKGRAPPGVGSGVGPGTFCRKP